MLRDVAKLKRERASVVAEMRAVVETAETREGAKSLTSEEESKCGELRSKVDKIDADISRAEFLNAEEARELSQDESRQKATFKDFGEFLQDVRSGNSSRLESRDVTMGNGPSAGFLVPEQFDTQIRMIDPESAVIRPRSMVIPSGSAPDAAFNMPTLDQSGDLGVYSGVVMRWADETGAVQDAGDPRIRMVKIEPKKLTGFIDVSDKLLANSAEAGSLVQQLLRSAILGVEDDTFLRGDGVGKPLGVLSSNATIAVDRTTVNQINFADLVSMMSIFKGTNGVWVVAKTALRQLMTMVAAGTNTLVWKPGEPLLGMPVILSEYAPTLGNQGDIALLDLSYYAIKDGSPLAIFMDPYTQKGNGLTRIYAFWNVDGQARLSGSMLTGDGVTRVSPFVTLAA